MKLNSKIIIPAIFITIVSIAIIGYFYFMLSTIHHRPSPDGLHHKSHERGSGIFKLLGNVAILIGAACFSWFLFKKKSKTSTKAIKKAAKKVYSLHAYFGWTALILVVIHGGGFVILSGGLLVGILSIISLVEWKLKQKVITPQEIN